MQRNTLKKHLWQEINEMCSQEKQYPQTRSEKRRMYKELMKYAKKHKVIS